MTYSDCNLLTHFVVLEVFKLSKFGNLLRKILVCTDCLVCLNRKNISLVDSGSNAQLARKL